MFIHKYTPTWCPLTNNYIILWKETPHFKWFCLKWHFAQNQLTTHNRDLLYWHPVQFCSSYQPLTQQHNTDCEYLNYDLFQKTVGLKYSIVFPTKINKHSLKILYHCCWCLWFMVSIVDEYEYCGVVTAWLLTGQNQRTTGEKPVPVHFNICKLHKWQQTFAASPPEDHFLLFLE